MSDDEGITMTDCVFCPANWPNLDIVRTVDDNFAIVNPLNPVTEGHVLVISGTHTPTAATDGPAAADGWQVAADLMYLAAQWVAGHYGMDANIITSIGAAATQTVMHTHVHVVPRRPGDGLPLPWTPQHQQRARREAKARADAALWP